MSCNLLFSASLICIFSSSFCLSARFLSCSSDFIFSISSYCLILESSSIFFLLNSSCSLSIFFNSSSKAFLLSINFSLYCFNFDFSSATFFQFSMFIFLSFSICFCLKSSVTIFFFESPICSSILFSFLLVSSPCFTLSYASLLNIIEIDISSSLPSLERCSNSLLTPSLIHLS